MTVNADWRRRPLASLAVLVLIAAVGAVGCSRPSSTAGSSSAETVDPAQRLQRMSDTLARARHLTFKATRHLDAALVDGTARAESADIEVWVSRPRMLRARSTSAAAIRGFYTDGTRVSLLDESMNLYASEPLSGTIDEVFDVLDERYGFTPPLAEFILNDPYRKLSTLIQNSAFAGTERLNGEECDHLTLTGEVADADLWISRTDYLPRRFVATFKDREGSPQLKIDFSEWNLSPALDDALFAFTPPAGAEKIIMTSVEDAHAADTTGGAK
jgi:hypothetical protein